MAEPTTRKRPSRAIPHQVMTDHAEKALKASLELTPFYQQLIEVMAHHLFYYQAKIMAIENWLYAMDSMEEAVAEKPEGGNG